MNNQPPKERKVKVYGPVFMANASSIYMTDMKKMQKKGWHVISATEIGNKRLNVIYEKD